MPKILEDRVSVGRYGREVAGVPPEFTDFMRADIDWYSPAEYAAAFDGLIVEDLEQQAFERECARELYGDLDE